MSTNNVEMVQDAVILIVHFAWQCPFLPCVFVRTVCTWFMKFSTSLPLIILLFCFQKGAQISFPIMPLYRPEEDRRGADC